MTHYPVIEGYRAELCACGLPRQDDIGMARVQNRLRQALQTVGIADVHHYPEVSALFDMLIEERAPDEAIDQFCRRYSHDRIVKGMRRKTCL